ncbi:creatininase family protein [Peribacillus sp. B-H-3]|jgi:creatinine amidohydrolase|uniref:creatininase family protein n=1 Tax=Peribacillus sp. B-H-3 TaxID=3400420 RepID=UPI003B0249C4
MSFIELKYLTSSEAAAAAREIGAIGLIPVGALEQHGPHLPLVTDSAMVEVLAAKAARRFREPVIVTPTLMAGLSEHHVEFPGTVTLDRKTLKTEILAYITTLNRMGLTRIGLLSFHGGNFSLLGEFADDNKLALQGIHIEAYTDFRRFLNVMFNAGQKAGLQLASTDSHAGALETSLALHVLGEERVREFETVRGYTRDDQGWMETMQAKGVKAVSSTGVFGTPCGASARAGKLILDALVNEVVLWLGETFQLEEIR